MVNVGDIIVSANFDTGDFMGTFSVVKLTNSYHSWDECIQKQYSLSYDDFTAISFMIANVVNEYVNNKSKESK